MAKRLAKCFLGVALVACTPNSGSQPGNHPTAATQQPSVAHAQPETNPISQLPATPNHLTAPPAEASTSPSGLAWLVLKPGHGSEHPALQDTVSVHYSGWTTDGKLFDSSLQRGKPAVFPLNRVIRGWTEGVAAMVVGEKRRLWIPEDMAYGSNPPPGAPKGMLVFDIELLDITKGKPPLPAPADVAAPPKQAKKTASGLHYLVLQSGHGKKHPQPTAQVEVHYTGWTTDGKMFDSSVQRGQSATFPLNAVIKGWSEGVALMVEGEKTRFWIPVELAYNHQPNRPDGMLVFDIELIKIH